VPLASYSALLLLGQLASLPASPVEPAPDAWALLESMGRSTAAVRDYTMTLVKQDRLAGTLEREQTFQVKWARPHSIYMKTLTGSYPGQEVIYVEGWNRNRMMAHRGSFPDVNISLDPRGRLPMAHAHHPITEASVIHLVDLVLRNVGRARQDGALQLRRSGAQTLSGRSCWKVEAEASVVFDTDEVREGETLWDVARRHGTTMSLLLHANAEQGFKHAGGVRAGDRVKVPRYYARRLDLWLDQQTHLPLRVEVYDHEDALYERYEHRDLRVNVGLGPADFDPDNPAYRF
jgi:hypothetical protein